MAGITQSAPAADGSDPALVSRAAAGDARAFEALMRRYNRMLFRTARAILRDDAEAEDALQEAYLQAYRSPGSYRAVFMLRAVEELSAEETATVLDLPPATVRTRLFRARSLLREALAQKIDVACEDAFSFAGERCDRVVASVLARLNQPKETS